MKKAKTLSPKEAAVLNRLILMENKYEESEAKAMAWGDNRLSDEENTALRLFLKGEAKPEWLDQRNWNGFDKKWGWVRDLGLRIAEYQQRNAQVLKNDQMQTAMFQTGWYL